MDELKRGLREIRDAKLQVFDNLYPHRDYLITILNPEFTCLCPRTGYPDFAVIEIKYIPNRFCLELKSWKLFINQYRDRGIFHEEVTNELLEALIKTLKPRYLHIRGDFNPRGNVHTIVTAEYRSRGFIKKIPLE